MMNTRKNQLIIIFSFFIFHFSLFICFAQTAEEIDALLSSEAVSYEQAAWLILMAADKSDAAPAEAFQYAVENNWLPAKAVQQGNAKLEDVSLLIMQSFDLKGGLFYTWRQNSHYAYRELVYRGIIQGRSDPEMAVSGDLLLYMTNRMLSWREGE